VTAVTAAEPAHAEAVAALAEEMDRFYGATETQPLGLRTRQVSEALFSNPPAAYALLAWDGDHLVGLAAYSFVWPAVGLTRSLFLKELYVAEAARRAGVGKLLMHSLYQTALQHACSRVEWTTDQYNADAQRFYTKIGIPVDESKLFYRLEGEQLRQAATGN